MPNEAEMTAWLVGGLIAAILLLYALWALFGDRSRGRRRCPRCSYELGEVPGTLCSECGFDAGSESSLKKPRRHWMRAFGALLLMLIVAFLVRMRATETSWLMLVPDRILVFSIPMDSRPRAGPIIIELKRRLLFEQLSEGAADDLMNRLVEGDAASPPGTEEWERRYGHLAKHWGKIILDKESPRVQDMLEIQPQVHVTLPGSWPNDKPIPALLSIEEWWPLGTEGHIIIRWPTFDSDRDGEELANIAFRNYGSGGRPFPLELPPRSEWPRGTTVDLEVEIQKRRPAEGWTGEPSESMEWEAWSEPQSASARVIAPTDGVISLDAVDEPELDQLVERIFKPGLRRFTSTYRPYAIRFDPRALQDGSPKGMAFGFRAEIVELLPDGTEHVRRRSRIWINTSPNTLVRSGWMISEEDSSALAGAFDEANTNSWVMRVSGDRALSERVLAQASGDLGTYTSFWNGSIEFPLPVHQERGGSFIRHWFHEDGPPKPE